MCFLSVCALYKHTNLRNTLIGVVCVLVFGDVCQNCILCVIYMFEKVRAWEVEFADRPRALTARAEAAQVPVGRQV